MSEETKKYLIVEEDSIYQLEEGINAFVGVGYKLHTFTVIKKEDEFTKYNQYIAVMSLSSAKYDDIESLRDVPPGEANKLLSGGWIVADSYSKFIRMVKKK